MSVLKKSVLPALLALCLLTAALAAPLSARAAAPSPGAAADKALVFFKTSFAAGYGGGEPTYFADIWTQLILQSAGKLADADYAFMVPEVDADALLTPQPEDPKVPDGPKKPLNAAALAKGVITLVSQGKDPASFGGKNLVGALGDLQAANGSFGPLSADTAFAVMALEAAGYDGYDKDKAVSALAALKKADGGYNDYGGSTGSPDSTAYAVMGFAAARTEAALAQTAGALDFLKSTLRDTGYFVGNGPFDSPNACTQATVLLALVAAGEDVTSSVWKKAGVSVLDTLLALQAESGGFWYDAAAKAGKNQYFPAPDQFTNYQALLGLYALAAGESPIMALLPDAQNIPDAVSNSENSISFDLSGVTLSPGVTSVTLGGQALPQSGATFAAVQKLAGGNLASGALKSLVLYDLKLLNQNGNPLESFSGKIKVKIRIPSGMSGDLRVFWYDPAAGTLTDMNAKTEDGFLVFETDHFSVFAVAQLGSDNPDTGDSMNPVVWVVMGVAVVAILAAVLLPVIKKRKK